jgi:regulator of sigma E protease
MGDAGAASEPDTAKLAEMRARLGPDAERCFHFKPIWQRAFIVVAGPLANFILAIAIFSIIAGAMGERGLEPVVGAVGPGTSAEEAGFEVGDRIVSIAGRDIDSFNDIRMELMWRPNEVVPFDIERSGAMITLMAAARLERRPDGLGGYRELAIIGVGPSGEEYHRTFGLFGSIGAGVSQVGSIIEATGRYVGNVIAGRAPANMLNGPLGIVTVSGQIANGTVDNAPNAGTAAGRLALNLIQLAGFFSIGLGLVNLLPIPILDGGHLVYYAYEAVAGRPLSEKAQAIGFKVGLFLVLGMMLVATWNDLVYLGGLVS